MQKNKTVNSLLNKLRTLFLIGCLLSGSILSAQSLSDMTYGTDSTFEVMSWNIEWFPKTANTVDSVKVIIEALDIDVIAIQEIDNETEFDSMLEELDGWEGFSFISTYLELAYIYNSENVEVDSIYEILTDNSRVFPRPPLVMEVNSNGVDYIILNNHLKCCGDGYMNTANLWDEEVRRRDACLLVDSYIAANWPDEKVILLGDLNDRLNDSENNNVFQNFIDDSTSYRFLDMEIALGDQDDWSYPSWPSHLDHVLISNELFNEFDLNNASIETIKIENYLADGFDDYDQYISDHRPIAIKIPYSSLASSIDKYDNDYVAFSLYPNPANDILIIESKSSVKNALIEVYTIDGVLYDSYSLTNFTRLELSVSSYSKGAYFIRLSDEEKRSITKKLLLQ